MILWRGLSVAIGLLVLWYLVVVIFHLPDYILPTPWRVLQTWYQQRDLLLTQAQPTIIETLLGLFMGVLIGCIGAFTIAIFKPARLWILPVLIISQAIPTFAIAPLLVVWLGYGMASKIATAAIMIFFPVTTALYDGLNRTKNIWLDLAKTMNASPWKILYQIRLPAALPQFASGLRIATAIAPIGAIIGEWVGSSHGLGFLLLNANARLQIDMMFAALLTITLLTLLLYFSVDKCLNYFIDWQDS